jgi:alanyl-tRNA synthetase
MTLQEVREKYLNFMRSKGHEVIPSASLVPENDPTTLFTGSGMQPLVPYLLGAPHPKGKRVANSQKSFRAEDIDEVGDNRHTTFFEMLGNWSFGDYFKAEQLPWFFEFLTAELGLDPKNIYVTVFAGDPETGIPADEESVAIWQKLFGEKGIEANYVQLGSEEEGSVKGMQRGRIFSYDVKKNWWSRAGVPSKMPAGEPGGPDSEVFYDFGTPHDVKFGKQCHPNCDCGRFLEIGNSVFMEYIKKEDGTFEKLAQRNVDFGGGLERVLMAANGEPDIFKVDAFQAGWAHLETILRSSSTDSINVKRARIILDHLRASAHLIADGVVPGNKDRGYVLRRLLRRAIFQATNLVKQDEKIYSEPEDRTEDLAVRTKTAIRVVIESFFGIYPDLAPKKDTIFELVDKETGRFIDILQSQSELRKVLQESGKRVKGEAAFTLFSTFGLPLDYIVDEARAAGVGVDVEGFNAAFEKHQELSRTSSAGAFKGGLADHSEKTTQLHTAHHLLLKALQSVLGSEVKQRGSNITSERLRLDFAYGAKMTDEQKKEVERIVNEKIAEDLPVLRTEMAKEDAEKLGAEHEFGQKYPDRVSLYSIGPREATPEDPRFPEAFSIEFCGGPHVGRTSEIKGVFRIQKEEASSAGIRRIKGILE